MQTKKLTVTGATLVLAAGTLLLGCAGEPPAPEPDPLAGLPALTDLPAEAWTQVAAGGETACSDGSEYSFFVRPADPSKLLVYLEGGGACWNAATCDVEGRPSYKPVVGDSDPAKAGGIFDFSNTENPFSDYTMVYAPYCTGDVHLGDSVATYEVAATDEAPAKTITIRFQGHKNVERVLAWTYGNVTDPQAVFVTGSSAGAIPSPHYAVHLAEHYPQARITQLGDAAGGYRRASGGDRPDLQWGTLQLLGKEDAAYADMPEDAFSYEELYVEAATEHPEVTFARYDAAEDAVQLRFLGLSGNKADSLLPLLEANESDITSKVKNFAAFIMGGDVHTVLGRPEFYTYRVDKMRVRDWVAALAAGQPVETVHCEECAEPALIEGAAVAATGGR